jgi:Tfp pilus assembly protein PilO
MKIQSYKTRLGILAATWAAGAMVAGMFYVVVLSPAWQHLAWLDKELADEKRELDWATEATLSDRLSQVAADVASLDSRAGDLTCTPEGLADLVFSIGRLAADRKVSNVSVQPQDTKAATTQRITERRLKVECSGGFHDFAGLLNDFERHRPVLFVDAFSIQRPSTPVEKLSTDMTVTVLVDTPPPGPVQTPLPR